MKRSWLYVAPVVMLAAAAVAGTASGLKPGSSVPAFQVVDVTGPKKGQQLCYRCSYGQAPVVAAFIKGTGTDAAKVLGNLQAVVEKNKGVKSFVVFMGGPELKSSIEKIAADKKISIPLTLLPNGPLAADIAGYQINPQVDNTILLWNKGTVRAGFANVAETDWSAIEKATANLMK